MSTGSGRKASTLKQKLCLLGCGLGLLLSGCGTISSRPEPAYIQDPGGNAWVITLPKDSVIFPTKGTSLIPAVNEIDQTSGKLLQDCILVSPTYLQLRDERELELLKTIEELKIKSNP